MTTTPVPAGTGTGVPTEQALRDLLQHHIASYLDCPAHDVDPEARLMELGLDSIVALTLCGDIEDEYGIEVEPTTVWDHPTVNSLVGHLHTLLTDKAATPR